ncbi:MAG: DMT family transporter [Devosia sp.]|nr:DMT family transporter [Devosia sp.]
MEQTGELGDRPLRGILIMVTSLSVFAVLNGVVKEQAQHFPVNEIIFCRNLFGLVPLAFLLPRLGGIKILRPSRTWLLMAQALAMSVTLVCAYIAFATIPLAEASAVMFLQPIIMVVIAHFALGERGGTKGWAAVVIGFLGVLLIARPSGLAMGQGMLMALAAAVLSAIGVLLIRPLSRDNNSLTISVAYMLVSTAIFGPSLAFWWATPTPAQLAGLIVMGLVSGAAQFLMVLAYRYASVTTLGPVQYVNLLGSIVVGLLWFNEVPGLLTLLGVLVVMASVALVLPRRSKAAPVIAPAGLAG